MLGVLGHLEGIAGAIGGQIGKEDQRFSSSLLVIVYGYVIGFDFRHGVSPSDYGPLRRSRCADAPSPRSIDPHGVEFSAVIQPLSN